MSYPSALEQVVQEHESVCKYRFPPQPKFQEKNPARDTKLSSHIYIEHILVRLVFLIEHVHHGPFCVGFISPISWLNILKILRVATWF